VTSSSPPASQNETDAAREARLAGGRKRKRTPVNELEEKLAKLQEENTQLSQHLESVSCREETIRNYKREMKLKMGKLLCNSESPETEIAAVLTQFRQLYEHYGEQRQQEVHFHLAQLERLMLPTKNTKMVLWTIAQDEMYTGATDPVAGPSLLSILTEEVGFTDSQIAKLSEHRDKMNRLTDDLHRSLALLRKLKKSVDENQRVFADKMQTVQSALTPKQIARLILFVEANRSKIEPALKTARQIRQGSADV